MSRRRKSYSDYVLIRIIKKLILLLLIIGIPSILFLFTFNIKKIDVVGTERYTKEQIQDMVLQTKPDHYSIYLYLKYRFLDQPKIPFVEKMDIEMVDNHTVTVYVYEKMVAGCVEFMGEYFYFDKDGIIVESSPERIEKVPIIKGLKFNEIILKQKLELKEQKDELYDMIINLTQLIEKYELDVDTISFGRNYEVTAECGGIKVLLGRKKTYDEALSDLKAILEEAKGLELAELDMRNYQKGTSHVIGKQKESTD